MKTYITELTWLIGNMNELENLIKREDKVYILAAKGSNMPVSLYPILSSLAANTQMLFTEGKSLDFKTGFALGVSCLNSGEDIFLLTDESSELYGLADVLLTTSEGTAYQFKTIEPKKTKVRKGKLKTAEEEAPKDVPGSIQETTNLKNFATQASSDAKSTAAIPLALSKKFKQLLSKLQSNTSCRPSLVLNADKIFFAITNSTDDFMSLDNALQRAFGSDSQQIYDAIAPSFNELKAITIQTP